MDVHKDSITITIAVLPATAKTPTRLERQPNDLPKLKRFLDRAARAGELRACYEASGAGYVLHRALRDWGYACDGIAPSLIPKRPGVQRKHDKRDATELARYYRAGELTAVRIPSEVEQPALTPALAAAVARLQCFRGIARQGAMVPATEIVGWRRFERPGQLAAYLGLVAREDSSGRGNERAPSPRPGTVTAATSWCRRLGATTTGRI